MLLINEQQESYENGNFCYDCKEKIENKIIVKLDIIVIMKGNTEVMRIAYTI